MNKIYIDREKLIKLEEKNMLRIDRIIKVLENNL
jgi:hypothetical protein